MSMHRREMFQGSHSTLTPGLFGRVNNYFARARARRQLQQLDDRMLADIGIARSEIEKIVWDN